MVRNPGQGSPLARRVPGGEGGGTVVRTLAVLAVLIAACGLVALAAVPVR